MMCEVAVDTQVILDMQRLLTSVPAINPEYGGEGEWRKARALKDRLRTLGFPPPVHYDTPDPRTPEGTRPNFCVRIPGRTPKPCLWVMTHLDVVPPGERLPDGSWKGWNTDPYQLHVDGDMLYGRGVEDNHHPLVASVIAARRLLESDTTPPNDIALLFVSAEETGSRYGLQHVLRHNPGLFDPQDIILVPDGGNEKGSLIEIAEKSVLWLNIHMTGKQTHGSTPHLGNNAFRAMTALVAELDRRLHRQFGDADPLFRPPHSTFEPTRHGANVPNINTIPGEETFSVDCRVLPRYGLDEVLEVVCTVMKGIDDRFGVRSVFDVENRLDAPPPTAPDAPVVQVLQRALQETRGLQGDPGGLGGSTVAAFFREAGYPAVVWSTIEGVAHQVNERARISSMLADADVYEHIFRHGWDGP